MKIRTNLKKIRINLREVLRNNDLLFHGVEKKIAEDLGIHRHTIGKLMRGQSENPSLKVLEGICTWLIEQGVPSENLLGKRQLLGFQEVSIWQVIEFNKEIDIYQGSYDQSIGGESGLLLPPTTIAHHDSISGISITDFINSIKTEGRLPLIKTITVPFKFRQDVTKVEGDWFEEDKEKAIRKFLQMKDPAWNATSILLGSQRSNYLVEYMLAELFGCEPFQNTMDEIKSPIYLKYRDFDWPVPSCFGGNENPPKFEGEAVPGVYYLDANEDWQVKEWKDNEADPGILVVVRDGNIFRIAVVGLTGISTSSMTTKLIEEDANFLSAQPIVESDDGNSPKTNVIDNLVAFNDIEVGVFICNSSSADNTGKGNQEIDENAVHYTVTAESLDKQVIERFLK